MVLVPEVVACDGGFVTLVDMILPGRGLLGNRSHAWLDTVASFGLEYERALGPAGHLKDEAGWAGRELAARPAVDPGGGRAAVISMCDGMRLGSEAGGNAAASVWYDHRAATHAGRYGGARRDDQRCGISPRSPARSAASASGCLWGSRVE